MPALIIALRDPLDGVRMSACVALGDLKAREAVPDLIDLVTGKTPSGKGYSLFIPQDVGAVQWMAARALGRIGDSRAVEPLMNALGKPGEIWESILPKPWGISVIAGRCRYWWRR